VEFSGKMPKKWNFGFFFQKKFFFLLKSRNFSKKNKNFFNPILVVPDLRVIGLDPVLYCVKLTAYFKNTSKASWNCRKNKTVFIFNI
jgi:hypothetical protein